MQADTCFWMMPNVPTAAAATKSMTLTMKHEAAEFCMPTITREVHSASFHKRFLPIYRDFVNKEYGWFLFLKPDIGRFI